MPIDDAAGVMNPDAAVTDLGPLAWVLEELRKSLDAANKSLRRFVRDVEVARGTDIASVDASQIRTARQQMHQAVGALEMVGMVAPAHMLRAMESAVQLFVQRPENCNEVSVALLERASFALVEYLGLVLGGAQQSAVGLFPQYRDAQLLAAAGRIHPADLWSMGWRWIRPELVAVEPEAISQVGSDRARVDQAVLQVMQKGDPAAAGVLRDVSLALAQTASHGNTGIFWTICAGFFEAVGKALLPVDLYAKRAASQVLLHYAAFVRGDQNVSDRLARDLVFFCAQAVPGAKQEAPCLEAVRKAYGLSQFERVDYEVRLYGRFDPAVLAQARKRIDAVMESWSALAGGDPSRFKNVVDQFGLVADSILKLHPSGVRLADGLKHAAEATVRSGKPPAPSVALEVATSVLYLEAAFAERNPDEDELSSRTNRLADRLDHVCAGGDAEPLESWMEELYRRVSDRRTMGTVVGELRVTLSEAEKALDQFFRNPDDKAVLNDVPGLLAQMRGVLSVLGLEQATQAVMRMRESVEQILVTEVDIERARAAGTMDRLGNNLGALGFLIDMLNYQPTLAKKLFVYDAEMGELRSLMGRSVAQPDVALAEPGVAVSVPEATSADPQAWKATALLDAGLPGGAEAEPDWGVELDLSGELPDAVRALAQEEAGALPVPVPVPVPLPLRDVGTANESSAVQKAGVAAESQIEVTEIDEEDIQDIFLDEAREVIANGIEALDALADDPTDMAQQTTLRRAFHTLKGSARMVGLVAFGEAAWALEQLLNAWLSEQKPASAELRGLSREALEAFAKWVEDVSLGVAERWNAEVFQDAANALRKENTRWPIVLPAHDALMPVDMAETEAQAAPVLPLSESGDAGEDVAGQQSREALVVDDVPEVEAPAEIALEQVAEAQPPCIADDVALAASASVVAEPLVDFEPAEGLAPVLADEAEEDQFRVIGTLRIGIPLYNVYLNEADEWSRRLLTLLTEWSLECHRPVPEDAELLAHSLAGSSGTVGFMPLSDMARALEHALQRVREQRRGTAEQARIFRAAAEDIRRLLHQFAAGFLKEPSQEILGELNALEFNEDVAAGSGKGNVFELSPSRFALAELPEPSEPPVEVPVLAKERSDRPSASELQGLTGLESESEAAEQPVASTVAAMVPVPLTPPAFRVPGPAALDGFSGQPGAFDETDLMDVLDPDLFPIFEEEAGELLPQLGSALRQWAARPDNTTARGEVLRALHTLKGSSRLAGALRLGEMAHRLESEIESLGREVVLGDEITPLLARVDTLEGNFEALRQVNLQAATPETAQQQRTAASSLLETPDVPSTVMANADANAPAADTPAAIALPAQMLVAPVRAAANQAVRVRSQLLDRLVNQAGEVMITRARLEAEMGQLRGSLGDLTGNLDRLRQQLRDIELQAESQMQSRMAQTKDAQQNFDPLEFDRFTRVQELTRMMAESVNDVATVQRSLQRTVDATEDDLVAQARQTRALQQDLLRTRMMEFEGISERLYRVVRQAAKDMGKQVKLDIVGGSIEMDRGVLDRMTAAFEHLLRNCVVHGIEAPAMRASLGKEPVGTITINLQQAGNDVSVAFHDDGAGLDVPRILEKALQKGLVAQGQTLTDEQAANLIFMPGFTTTTEVTELAGRGIGMDVVRAEVQALGGRIETVTQAGKGTSFKMVLPLTTAVTQVVVMRSGALVIGVPANVVELVRRVTSQEMEQAYRSGVMDFAGEPIPFFWSGALLQSSAHSTEPTTRTMSVVVFRSAAQRVAVHMDEILGSQEAVVKNLGPQLSRLPGLAGMTVLASGAVVLIYNPVALAAVYGEQARALRAAQVVVAPAPTEGDARSELVVAEAAQVPLIMVVDDSITVRRVTQRLLHREGYRVTLAADGLQALEKLQEESPVLVLSDIEMPRMDGFDLARNIRADARLKNVPIIMITSRIAEKHREHAQSLGVNHYLGKPYSEDELLSLVRRYAHAPIAA